ncbi:MAG: ABC transporter ATP-binding protein [Candidatus Omnitrophica bacterium]|nr:ABC transporter ATP-binding protein [Candidatus Omnitrophota bacterium]
MNRTNAPATILETEDLWKEYRQGRTRLEVLKGINLRIKAGEVAVIKGPSGAGKSTLLHLLGGLDRPTRGSIRLGDSSWNRLSESRRSRLRGRGVGFVFQSYHLLEALNAVENVGLPARIHRGVRNVRGRAAELLDQVGLADRVKHRPSQLSGGEKQRVAIARALMNSPEVLLCDEPTGNLDTVNGRAIKQILWKLNRDQGKTVVIVTHDLELTRDADRVIELCDGKIV